MQNWAVVPRTSRLSAPRSDRNPPWSRRQSSLGCCAKSLQRGKTRKRSNKQHKWVAFSYSIISEQYDVGLPAFPEDVRQVISAQLLYIISNFAGWKNSQFALLHKLCCRVFLYSLYSYLSTTVGVNIRSFYYSCETIVCTKFVQRHRSYYGMNMTYHMHITSYCLTVVVWRQMVLWDVNIQHLRARFSKPCGQSFRL